MSSQFDPYLNEVKEWRAEGNTWREIAENLSEHGLKPHRATVQQWFTRRIQRAAKISKELEALDKLEARKTMQKSSLNSPQITPQTSPKKTEESSSILNKSDEEIVEELQNSNPSENEENPFKTKK